MVYPKELRILVFLLLFSLFVEEKGNGFSLQVKLYDVLYEYVLYMRRQRIPQQRIHQKFSFKPRLKVFQD